jgi:hypothetical protein
LRRNPGFAAVAVLSLALGIGATTAMFSLIYAVLLHPFPYADADRIVNLFGLTESAAGTSFTWAALSKAQIDDLGRATPVESVLGFNPTQMEITGAAPEEIAGTYLTENAGTFFGVHPLLGRNIEPSDAENGGHSVVVLNYRFWQRHFGGDPQSPAGRLGLWVPPASAAGAFSSPRKSLSHCFSWPLRAPPSAAFLGSCGRRLATIPQMS